MLSAEEGFRRLMIGDKALLAAVAEPDGGSTARRDSTSGRNC